MLLITIISAIAGYITPIAEPHVSKLAQSLLKPKDAFEPGEMRATTFAVLMIGVAILAMITGTKAAALPVAFGGALGLLGTRIYHAVRAQMDARKANNAEDIAED